MYRLLLCSLVLISACGMADVRKSRFPKQIAVGMEYLDYDERKDRSVLKKFLGVDPSKTEWCAAYVNSVLKKSGIPGSESVSNVPLMARSFLDWGWPIKVPEPGDIVVFPRGNRGWQGHVGFYIETKIIDGIEYYIILGGNQDDKVSLKMYKASSAIGIRRYEL